MKHLMLVLLTFFVLVSSAQNPVCGFQFKKTITIDGGQVTGTQTNFPVLISHTDPDLTAASAKVTSPSGFDIVFADDNGQLLEFQMESYNALTGEYVAWVKLPNLTNGTDTDIHMLYGKSSITTDQSSNTTWDVNYEGVWHMNQDPSGAGPQILDFTGSSINGTANGAMTSGDLVSGKCGEGIDFDGSNDFISLGDVIIDGLTNITIEAWFNAGSIPTNTGPSGHNSNEGAIVHKNGSSDDNLGITVSTGGMVGYIDDGSDNTATGTVPTLSAWTHVVMTWNNSVMTLYRNGVVDATLGSINGSFVNNNNPLRIGGGHVAGGSPHEFDGVIDEVRISSVSRSADYAATSYSSQNQTTTTIGAITAGDFYTVSTEEDVFHTSTGNGDWDATSIWDNGEVPDGQFENATILHDVDIDGASANYTICDCQLISTGAISTRLDISSTRTLRIKGDLTGTLSGTSNVQSARFRLQNSAIVNVEGNVTMTHSNSGAARDLDIQMDNTSSLNVDGNLTLSTISPAADDARINLDDDITLNVTGDLNFINDGGDQLNLNIDNNAAINIGGNFNGSLTGGNDINVTFNQTTTGSASMTIGGNVVLNHVTGDDLVIDMAENSALSINGNLLMTQSGGDESRIIMDDASTLSLTGNLGITQNGGDDVFIYMNHNSGVAATLTIGGTTDILKMGGDDIVFRTSGASSNITYTGQTTIDCPSLLETEDLQFDANDGNMIFGDISLSRSLDMGEVDFDLDGGDITVASLAASSSGTLFLESQVTIDIDQASVFTCSGDLTVSLTGSDDFRIGINRNTGTTGSFNCGGDLTVTQSGGDDVDFFIYEDGQFNVTGNFTIVQTGGEEFVFDIDDNGQVNINGNFSLTHSEGQNGNINLAAGGAPSLTVNGDFTVSNTGGGDEIIIDVNGGTMQVNGSMTLNVSGTGITEDIDLEVDGTASLVVGTAFNANLTGGDDIEIEIGNNSAGSTASMTVNGDVTIFQNVPSAGHIITFFVFDNTTFDCDNLTLTQNSAGGDLLLMHLANTALATINGNIDINAAGSGDIEIRLDNTSKLRIEGNFDRTPSAFGELDMATTSILEFFGSTATQVFPQDAGAGGDVFDYGIVEINNTFGSSPQITMEGFATVHGGIVFIDGIVSSGAANLLVIDAGATASGASDNSHVDGLMRKTGADNFEFPSGDQGVWAPIEITNLNASLDFDAEYFFANHSDISVIAPLIYRSSIEHWTLDPSGPVSADVTLHWKDAARSGINTFTSDLVVAHYDGADWESYGNDLMTTTDPGEIRAEGVTVFSPFTFGSLSTDLTVNPLPVELLSFQAQKNENAVDLKWTTASEINNSHFVVERSIDGLVFTSILTTNGVGNSTSIIDYFETDYKPLQGVSYYRLKQVDHDGTHMYSHSVPVSFSEEHNQNITVFPNPVSNSSSLISLTLSGFEGESVSIELRDARGKEIYKTITTPERSQIIHTIPFNKAIRSGLYLITVTSNSTAYLQKLIIK